MGAMRTEHTCTWAMKLGDHGYTCWELHDQGGRRWGWAVNASAAGWTAHVGDFGQGADVGRGPVPIEQFCESIDSIHEAKAWIEEMIAIQWRARYERVSAG